MVNFTNNHCHDQDLVIIIDICHGGSSCIITLITINIIIVMIMTKIMIFILFVFIMIIYYGLWLTMITGLIIAIMVMINDHGPCPGNSYGHVHVLVQPL